MMFSLYRIFENTRKRKEEEEGGGVVEENTNTPKKIPDPLLEHFAAPSVPAKRAHRKKQTSLAKSKHAKQKQHKMKSCGVNAPKKNLCTVALYKVKEYNTDSGNLCKLTPEISYFQCCFVLMVLMVETRTSPPTL